MECGTLIQRYSSLLSKPIDLPAGSQVTCKPYNRCNLCDVTKLKFSRCGGERCPRLIPVDLAKLWASVLLQRCFSTNYIVTSCEANLDICGSGEVPLILKELMTHLCAYMNGFGRSRDGQSSRYRRETISGHLFRSGEFPSNMNGLPNVVRREDTRGLIPGEYGRCGCCRTTQLYSRSFSCAGKDGAVLEEDMWVHAAMRSWIHEPWLPSRQSSDLALSLLMQQTFRFVRQCCRLP